MTPWKRCLDDERACAQLEMQILEALGVSRAALARHCGIHRSQTTRWAHGQRSIPAIYAPMLRRLRAAGLARLQAAEATDERLARLRRINACYAQLCVVQERMRDAIAAYEAEGLVLRELWSLQHG